MSDTCFDGKEHVLVGAKCQICFLVKQGDKWCACQQNGHRCTIHEWAPSVQNPPNPPTGCICQNPGKTPCPLHKPGPMNPPASRGVWLALLIERFGPNCHYCGVDVTTLDMKENWPSRDHLTPKVREGDSHPDNIRLACAKCNNLKGAKTEEEFWAYLEKQGLLKEG